MLGHYIFAVCTVVSTIVGFLVVYRNFGSVIHRLYALLTISFVILSAANFFSLQPADEQAFYVRTVMASTTLGLFLLYILASYLANPQYKPGRAAAVLLASTIAVAVLDYTPLLFTEIIAESPARPVAGPGAILYIIHFLVLAGLSFYKLFSSLHTANAKKAQQLRLVLLGVTPIVVFAPVTGFVLPLLFNYTQLVIISPLYTLFFVCCVGYAMAKHGLFDIKLAAVRSAAYALALIVLAAIYYLMAYIVSLTLFKSETTTQVSISPTNIFLALILAFMFQPIKQFFDRLTDSVFYRDAYTTDDFFARISELLGSTTDLRGLLERASAEIAGTFKAEQAYFFLYYNNAIHRHMSAGTHRHTKLPVQDAHLLDAYVDQSKQTTITTDELPHDAPVRRMLISHKIALVMPLRYAGHLIGYLFLGEQQRSGGYNKRDLKVLGTIADELVIGIQNALSIHAVKEINAHLQQRIDVATKELRSSNAQLRHLDEVKDEFMSMASHQLRTPLTSIKGYLSMVIEGDVGKITPQQRVLLEEAFNSSERMVRLIADFLNVSRLQTGKFVIEKGQVDFVHIVRDEVESLKLIADTHALKLHFKATEKAIIVPLDEAKIRQVVMNFIDNAIYYSRQSSTIQIHVEKTDDKAIFTVIDTGIGVPAEEQAMLFNKFFRAKNARQQRPDGTGVGLYLAKKVVMAHGGKMIFSSIEGKGSTFGFYLPLNSRQADNLNQ